MKLLTSLGIFFRFIWRRLFPVVKNYVFPAIEVVNAVKNSLENNDDLKKLLHAIYEDDNAVDIKLQQIANAIDRLGVFKQCIEKETAEDKIICFIQNVKKQPKTIRAGVYQKLARELYRETSGDKEYTNAEADTLVQVAYLKYKDQQLKSEA